MTGYARGSADFVAAERFRRDAKDYSVPLHVDCSIEYELPDCAKPPQGVKIEPLLMIHPAHFRRLESLRRVPFVNNLPREAPAGAPAPAPAAPAEAERRARPARRCCRAAPVPAAPPPPPLLPAASASASGRRRVHPYVVPVPYEPYERFDSRAAHLQPLPIYL